MKETFFFPHDYNARNDRKLIKLVSTHGMAGLGVYWCVVEMLYEEAGYLPIEYDRITFELRTEYDLVKSVINDFELFQFDEEKFWSETAISRLKLRMDKSEKARNSVLLRWEKYERNTNVIRTNNERNTRTVQNSTEQESKNQIDFEKIIEAYHASCPALPKITKLTDQRKAHLRARINEHGEEKLSEVFTLAGGSDYLCGKKNGWKANLDWILNPTNFLKVLEGNYKNSNESQNETRTSQCSIGIEDFQAHS